MEILKNNWVIILSVIGLVATWTTFGTRLTQAESDIRDLKTAIIEINNLKIKIERIDTSVEFIKNRVK